MITARTNRALLLSFVCASSFAAACGGGDARPAPDLGARDGGGDLGPQDASIDEDAGPALDAALDVDAGSALDAGLELDAGAAPDAGSALDAGPSAVGVSVAAFIAYSNCMPIVAPDPVIAVWDAVFTNTGSTSVTATLTAATLTTTPAGGVATVSAITVDVTVVDVAAGGVTVSMRKTSAVPAPPGACSTLCSGRAKLLLTFDLGGTVTTVESVEIDTGCVY